MGGRLHLTTPGGTADHAIQSSSANLCALRAEPPESRSLRRGAYDERLEIGGAALPSAETPGDREGLSDPIQRGLQSLEASFQESRRGCSPIQPIKAPSLIDPSASPDMLASRRWKRVDGSVAVAPDVQLRGRDPGPRGREPMPWHRASMGGISATGQTVHGSCSTIPTCHRPRLDPACRPVIDRPPAQWTGKPARDSATI